MRAQSPRNLRVTDPQRRHLTVFLAQVEDALFRLEQLAHDPPGRRRLRTDHRDLPADFAAAIPADLIRLRQDLAALADALGLEPIQESRAREAQGLLAISMVQLEDAGARGLRGYGPVDPELATELDPALEGLRDGLARLASRLGVTDAPRNQ